MLVTYEYCYNDAAKQTVAKNLKAALRRVARALKLEPGQYDLRFNPGGIAVWGEVTLHTNTLYVQASRTYGPRVLVRTCKGRRDYTGGPNHWLSLALLQDPAKFAAALQGVR